MIYGQTAIPATRPRLHSWCRWCGGKSPSEAFDFCRSCWARSGRWRRPSGRAEVGLRPYKQRTQDGLNIQADSAHFLILGLVTVGFVRLAGAVVVAEVMQTDTSID